MTVTINESNMTFGPFPKDDCYELEESAIYKRIQQGVMIPEFALIQRPAEKPIRIIFVEAKSSAPRPKTGNFDVFIDEIRQKMSNGLQTVWAACLNRHEEAPVDLPAGFRDLDLREDYRFILIINGHEDSWIQPLQDALNAAMGSFIKTIGKLSVVVINDKRAKKLNLIQ